MRCTVQHMREVEGFDMSTAIRVALLCLALLVAVPDSDAVHGVRAGEGVLCTPDLPCGKGKKRNHHTPAVAQGPRGGPQHPAAPLMGAIF
jgi:hypothetical protein